MNKRSCILVLATLLFCLMTRADVVKPYNVDFNQRISTSDPNFKVAPGWNHISESAYLNWSTKYVDYSYSSSSGVESSGALYIGSQTLTSGSWYSSEEKEVHDYLVTPSVSGNISLQVRSSNAKGYLEVYKCTHNSKGDLQVGDTVLLSADTVASKHFTNLSGSKYTKIDLGSFSEATMLAIRGNNIYIDDFSASQADIVYSRALTINNALAYSSTPDTQPDGCFPIRIVASLKNSGETDLLPGDSDYSLTVTDDESGDTIGTVAIGKSMKVGESIKDTIQVMAPYAKYSGNRGYRITENVSHTTYDYKVWICPIAYAPKLNVSIDGNSVTDGAKIDFGKIRANVDKKVILTNSGAKELNITSLKVPQGFKISNSSVTIAPHMRDTVTVTALAQTPGNYSGSMSIKADEIDSFSIELTSTVLDSTLYFVDFEKNELPGGSLNEGSNWTIASWNFEGNKYVLSNSQIINTKFITPLLDVKEGDKIQFDCGRRSGASYVCVYYTSDRKNWIKVDSIGASQMSDENLSSSYYNSKYRLDTHTIGNIPAGRWYIAFGAGYANIDNIYGYHIVPVTHDLEISDVYIPSDGEVNSSLSASATIHNIAVNDETAGSYTAALHIGGEIAKAVSKEITAGSKTKFDFTFIPHKTGKMPAFIEFSFSDGFKLVSDTDTIDISEETVSSEVQIGDKTTTSNKVPVYLSYENSASETVYTADMLKNLKSGDRITGITYKGHGPSNDVKADLSIYLQNTQAEPATSAATFTPSSPDSLTLVYSDKYTYHDSNDDVISVDFAEPFVYEGNNMRVVVRSEKAGTWSSASFNVTNESKTFIHKNDSYNSYLTASWESAPTPVIYFNVVKNPKATTGTVTDSTGTAVSGAVVTFSTSDGIEYCDTTDINGRYSVNVLRDNLDYTLTVVAADYNPYRQHVDSLGCDINVVLTKATGLYISSFNLPHSGTVNSKIEATANIMNVISSPIEANSYSAQLYIANKAVADAANTYNLAPGAETTLHFGVTPHVAGNFPVYVQITYQGNIYKTPVTTLTISKESFGGEGQACDSTTLTTTQNVVPWSNYYKNYQGVIVYTPQQLGIQKGSTITHIRFRGAFNSSTAGKEAVSLYIGNTDETLADEGSDNMASELIADTASMTQILKMDSDSLRYGGSGYNIVRNVIDAEIPGGFIYDGRNIVIVFSGNHNDFSDNTIRYVADDKTNVTAWGRGTDSGDISNRSWQRPYSMPVMYFDYSSKCTVSGCVIRRKTHSPIANADVLLKSGDVEYSGTTDDEGKYSVDLARPSLVYNAIFSSEGCYPDTIHGIKFTDNSSVTVNDTLVEVPSFVRISGIVKGIDGLETDSVNTLDAKPLADASVTAKTEAGIVVATVTTAADGTYSIDSLSEDSIYTLTFDKPGYKDSTITFTAVTDTTINMTLWNYITLSISSTLKRSNDNAILNYKGICNGNVYSISGKLIGRNVRIADLPNGVYIFKGRKIINAGR